MLKSAVAAVHPFPYKLLVPDILVILRYVFGEDVESELMIVCKLVLPRERERESPHDDIKEYYLTWSTLRTKYSATSM